MESSGAFVIVSPQKKVNAVEGERISQPNGNKDDLERAKTEVLTHPLVLVFFLLFALAAMTFVFV
jgi:hypothetical protein